MEAGMINILLIRYGAYQDGVAQRELIMDVGRQIGYGISAVCCWFRMPYIIIKGTG